MTGQPMVIFEFESELDPSGDGGQRRVERHVVSLAQIQDYTKRKSGYTLRVPTREAAAGYVNDPIETRGVIGAGARWRCCGASHKQSLWISSLMVEPEQWRFRFRPAPSAQ